MKEKSENMQGREVRRLTPDDLDDYMDIYLNAYPAGKDLSAECRHKYDDRNRTAMEEYRHVNFFGLFQEDMLIAIMKLIDFDINLFGQMSKATGLMSLGVHPLYKRRGAAREMVRFFEKYTVESGAAVSLLLPFRMDFYRKLGYGCGTKLDEYQIPVEYLPGDGDLSPLRLLKKEELSKVIECHGDFVRKNHGALYKFEEELRDMRNDDDVRYLGCAAGEQLKGYAAFTFVSTSSCNYTRNEMDVKELVYDSPETLSTLLSGLRLQNDLAQSVRLRSGEPDFYHLLQSAQDLSGNYIDYGFLQTNVSAVGTMYKIPDVHTFIAMTAHRELPAENLTVGFCVSDEMEKQENRFTLIVSTEEDHRCSHWTYDSSEKSYDEAEVHVACKRSDLSSLFMGSAEFAGMERLGVMKIDKPAYTRRLDVLFHPQQKPFTNTDY